MGKAVVTNAFSVDVEDYFHVSAYNVVIDCNDWDSLPSRVEQNTNKMMSILDDHDTKGTFFVLGWVAERYPALVKRIAEEGHEVACHGMSHRLIYVQGRDEFKAEARDSKSLLEDITGKAVNGYRAASFSITKDSLWALDDLAELGFTYDSSVFPVRHDRYGIPGAPRHAFRVECASGGSIIELPMTTVNVLGWHMPVSGGGYFRIYPYAVTRSALRAFGRTGSPFVFYCHPWEIDPDQPLYDGGWLSNFRHRTNLRQCEMRIRRLLPDFSFGTMAALIENQTCSSLKMSEARPHFSSSLN